MLAAEVDDFLTERNFCCEETDRTPPLRLLLILRLSRLDEDGDDDVTVLRRRLIVSVLAEFVVVGGGEGVKKAEPPAVGRSVGVR